jgi:Ras-related protein Rab-21
LGNEIAVAIAGNKIDLEKNRNVNEAEAKAYADSVGAKHFHTSAKTNKGLEDVFNDLSARMLARRKEKNKVGNGGGKGGTTKQRLVIVDDAPPPAAKPGGCC